MHKKPVYTRYTYFEGFLCFGRYGMELRAAAGAQASHPALFIRGSFHTLLT